MRNNYAIVAEGLTKRFGTFTAADHISFKVREGEIFGFLGANGAGKTTAMRMLCGLVPAGSTGTIFLFATVFILVVSSFGLIVSNYSDTMQQGALIMFFFLVIFILTSGLLTPIAGMPSWAKAITTVNPLRYFIEAMRMLYLKGSSLSQLMPDFVALAVYAAVVGSWAVMSYKKNA